jgi:hypothetical protein
MAELYDDETSQSQSLAFKQVAVLHYTGAGNTYRALGQKLCACTCGEHKQLGNSRCVKKPLGAGCEDKSVSLRESRGQ